MIAIALVIGLAAGALGALLLLRGRLREAVRTQDDLAAVERAHEETRERLHGAERELAACEARLEAAESAFDARVKETIRAASAEAYRETNANFLELAGTKLGETVAPLRTSLDKVNEQVQELDRARAQSYGALTRQLGELGERTQALTTALRTPHVRGRWGEIQLKRVMELSGMLPHCDFDEQVSTTTETGRLRPDAIVHLPGGKQV